MSSSNRRNPASSLSLLRKLANLITGQTPKSQPKLASRPSRARPVQVKRGDSAVPLKANGPGELRKRGRRVTAGDAPEGTDTGTVLARRPTLRSNGPSALRRPVETGQVRQSFSHGRSKAVTVEVRKKRVITRGAPAEPSRGEPAPTVLRAPPAAGAPRTLTAEEHVMRVCVLQEARKADEEARRRAELAEADHRRREEERAAEEALHDAEEAAVKRQAEEETKKRAEEESRKRVDDEDSRRRAALVEADRRGEEEERAQSEAVRHVEEEQALCKGSEAERKRTEERSGPSSSDTLTAPELKSNANKSVMAKGAPHLAKAQPNKNDSRNRRPKKRAGATPQMPEAHDREKPARDSQQREKPKDTGKATPDALAASIENRTRFDTACQVLCLGLVPVVEATFEKEWGNNWVNEYEKIRSSARSNRNSDYRPLPRFEDRIDWDAADLLEALDVCWSQFKSSFPIGRSSKSPIYRLRDARNIWAHARQSNIKWFTERNTSLCYRGYN